METRTSLPFEEITPRELHARQVDGTAPRLIDVREPNEHEFCRIEPSELKPLGQISRWARELDTNEEVVLYCHTGARSAYASALLSRAGFQRVKNLVGGVDRWAVEIEPGMPRY